MLGIILGIGLYGLGWIAGYCSGSVMTHEKWIAVANKNKVKTDDLYPKKDT
jgi:hypothetical protein